MKKFLKFLLSFFCLLILNQSDFLFSDCKVCASSDCSTNTQTFFRPRSIIEDVSFFLGLNQYNYYRQYFQPDASECKDEKIHIAVGAFFEQSRKNIGGYFFFRKCRYYYTC